MPTPVTSTLTPQEYLDDVRAEILQKRLARARLLQGATGIGMEIKNGCLAVTMHDIEQYAKALSEKYAFKQSEALQFARDQAHTLGQYNTFLQRVRTTLKQIATAEISQLAEDYPVLSDVAVDSAPIDYFNAGASPNWCGYGNIILVNEGVTTCSVWQAVSRWAKQATSGMSDDEVCEQISSKSVDARVAERLRRQRVAIEFADHAINMESDDAVSAIPEIQHNMESMRSTSVSLEPPLRFVVLHELGHIALRHTDELREWAPDHMLSEIQRRERRAHMRQWEFAADAFAVKAIHERSEGDLRREGTSSAELRRDGGEAGFSLSGGVGMLGIILVFQMLGEAELAAEHRGTLTAPEMASHPPAGERLKEAMVRLLSYQQPADYVRKAFTDAESRWQAK